MKYLYKLFPIFLSLVIILSACASKTVPEKVSSEKISVMATLFPQYDFARQIAGEYADVTLLLPPGAESHSFEPSPNDMIQISQSQLFLYTGDRMEPWVPKMLAGFDDSDFLAVDGSQGISLEPEGNHSEHGDHAGFDPHIWTSPVKAKQMVKNITEALCQADPQHESAYEKNSSAYLEKLDQLDSNFREIARHGKRQDFVFGSRFACRYFAEEYNLQPLSPYDSCSAETEPSAQAMAHVIDYIQSAGIPVIYCQELTDEKTARSIAEATGAEILLFHSCHNVSKEDFQNGVTYLSLMEQNAEHLQKGLS